jgi:hypothetical protein
MTLGRDGLIPVGSGVELAPDERVVEGAAIRVGPISREVPGSVVVGAKVTVGLGVVEASPSVGVAMSDGFRVEASEIVGVAGTVSFDEAVSMGVVKSVPVIEGVPGAVSFKEAVGVIVGVTSPVGVAVVSVPLTGGETIGVSVGLSVKLSPGTTVGDPLTGGVGVSVTISLPVGVSVGDSVGVPLGPAVGVPDGSSVGVTVRVPVGVSVGVSDEGFVEVGTITVEVVPGISERILVRMSPKPVVGEVAVGDSVVAGVVSGVVALVVPTSVAVGVAVAVVDPSEVSLEVVVASSVGEGFKRLVMGSTMGTSIPSASLVGDAVVGEAVVGEAVVGEVAPVDSPVPENVTPSSEPRVDEGVDEIASSELVEIIPLGPNSIPLDEPLEDEAPCDEVVDSSSSDVGLLAELVG